MCPRISLDISAFFLSVTFYNFIYYILCICIKSVQKKSALIISNSSIYLLTILQDLFQFPTAGPEEGILLRTRQNLVKYNMSIRYKCTFFWTDFNMLPVIMILDDMINRSLLSTSDYNTCLSQCQKYTWASAGGEGQSMKLKKSSRFQRLLEFLC